ncbi:MAG: sugar phosphate isomerase/epimerase [Fibrobacteres bacterium]|nr:sugar phosphate isomerase/epimerase [Fibrobacterota bacterium]
MYFGFSTLACPDWDIDQIINCCKKNKFQALELHHLHLTPIVNDRNALKALKEKLEACGVKRLSIGTAVAFHHFKPEDMDAAIDLFKGFLEAGKILNAEYLRVFPNNVPEGKSKPETVVQIVKNIKSVLHLCTPDSPKLGLETHGDFYSSKLIREILEAVNSNRVGAVWDAHHTWRFENESFISTYENLKKHLLQLHFKDSKKGSEKLEHTIIGEGEFPLDGFAGFLKTVSYNGVLGVEYEKKWHPYMPDSAILIDGLPAVFDSIDKRIK